MSQWQPRFSRVKLPEPHTDSPVTPLDYMGSKITLSSVPSSTKDLGLSRTRSPSPATDPFPTRHSQYYFPDDMTVFLVSNNPNFIFALSLTIIY